MTKDPNLYDFIYPSLEIDGEIEREGLEGPHCHLKRVFSFP